MPVIITEEVRPLARRVVLYAPEVGRLAPSTTSLLGITQHAAIQGQASQ
jgi:hypothetical protein